jgi:hypothetical protein
LHPPAGVPAPPLLSHESASGVARIHRKISALLLIRDGPWSVGLRAFHPLGDADHTSRTPLTLHGCPSLDERGSGFALSRPP